MVAWHNDFEQPSYLHFWLLSPSETLVLSNTLTLWATFALKCSSGALSAACVQLGAVQGSSWRWKSLDILGQGSFLYMKVCMMIYCKGTSRRQAARKRNDLQRDFKQARISRNHDLPKKLPWNTSVDLPWSFRAPVNSHVLASASVEPSVELPWSFRYRGKSKSVFFHKPNHLR